MITDCRIYIILILLTEPIPVTVYCKLSTIKSAGNLNINYLEECVELGPFNFTQV